MLTCSLTGALALGLPWLLPLTLGVSLALVPAGAEARAHGWPARAWAPGLAAVASLIGHLLLGAASFDTVRWTWIPGPLDPALALRDALLAGGAAVAAAGLRGRLGPRGPACVAALALTLMVGGLWLAPWRGNPRMVRELAVEPPDHAYAFDGHLYLKIHHLMRGGQGFYAAKLQAMQRDRRGFLPRTPANFRLPTAFVVWTWLAPGSRGVLVLYLLGASATLFAAFLIGRTLTQGELLGGVLAAAALFPLLAFGAVTLYFPFVELWGVFPASWSVWLALRRRDGPAALLALAACLIRSLFLYLLAALALAWALERRWRSVGWVVGAGLGFVLAYALHVAQVHAVIEVDGRGVGGWVHLPDPRYLDGTLRFGAALTPLGWGWRWCALGLALALGMARARRGVEPRWLLGALVLVPTLAMLVVGRDATWGGYWGAIWLPWPLIGAGAAALGWPPRAPAPAEGAPVDGPTAEEPEA